MTKTQKIWYKKNRSILLKKQKNWRKNNPDKIKSKYINNKEHYLQKSKDNYQLNRSIRLKQAQIRYKMKHKDIKKKQKEKYKEMKLSLIYYYSKGTMKCKCCGENKTEFLSIDHIKGGGNKHRKVINSTGGGSFYKWLVSNNVPKGYRVLCFNCNLSIGFFGYCPHKPHVKR